MTRRKYQWHFHFLDIFLLFAPVSIIFYFLNVGSLASFLVTAASLVGIAHLIAESTGMIANYIGSDGVCHWVEGTQLIAVYLLIATAFYFL